MITIQVFDPAMCCSTGVCGPSVDPALPRFAADLEWLKSKSVKVERYNLAQEVGAFTSNPLVKATLNAQGMECLPLILVEGAIVSQGTYPTREVLAAAAAVSYEPGPTITRVKEQSPPLVSIGEPSKIGRG
jgi:Arsenical resistance operon protein ArsD